MIRKGIKILWDDSVEYVEIDLTKIGIFKLITSTIEWWKKEKKWVKWNTHSEITACIDGSFEIQIIYDQLKNRHLGEDEVRYGTATVWISPEEGSGRAHWKDNSGKKYSCEAEWERVSNSLIGERRRERVSRIQRKQQDFRALLVALDEKCALTGESTTDALEAAHLIPASQGGTEITGNGILLRADLHRLLDAGKFSINLNGDVVLNEVGKLSNFYRGMLVGKSLPQSTTVRVKEALECMQKVEGGA